MLPASSLPNATKTTPFFGKNIKYIVLGMSSIIPLRTKLSGAKNQHRMQPHRHMLESIAAQLAVESKLFRPIRAPLICQLDSTDTLLFSPLGPSPESA